MVVEVIVWVVDVETVANIWVVRVGQTIFVSSADNIVVA